MHRDRNFICWVLKRALTGWKGWDTSLSASQRERKAYKLWIGRGLNICLLCSPSAMAGWAGVTYWVQEVVECMGQQLCWQADLCGTGNSDRSSWDTEARSVLRHSRASCPLTVDSNSTWAREAMSQKHGCVLVLLSLDNNFVLRVFIAWASSPAYQDCFEDSSLV